MSVEGPGGSEGEGFYTETCRYTLASFNDWLSSALCPGNPVQDSTSICYFKKKSLADTVPLFQVETLSLGRAAVTPQSPGMRQAQSWPRGLSA